MPTSCCLASALVKASLLSQEIASASRAALPALPAAPHTVLLEMGLLDEIDAPGHTPGEHHGDPAAPLDRLARPDLQAQPVARRGRRGPPGCGFPSAGAKTRWNWPCTLKLTTMPCWGGPAGATSWWNRTWSPRRAFAAFWAWCTTSLCRPDSFPFWPKLMGAAPARRWLALARACPAIARAPAASAAPAIDEVENPDRKRTLGQRTRAPCGLALPRPAPARPAGCGLRALAASQTVPPRPGGRHCHLDRPGRAARSRPVPAIIDWLESENETG